jgi:hypothetical protein
MELSRSESFRCLAKWAILAGAVALAALPGCESDNAT